MHLTDVPYTFLELMNKYENLQAYEENIDNEWVDTQVESEEQMNIQCYSRKWYNIWH